MCGLSVWDVPRLADPAVPLFPCPQRLSLLPRLPRVYHRRQRSRACRRPVVSLRGRRRRTGGTAQLLPGTVPPPGVTVIEITFTTYQNNAQRYRRYG